MDTLGKKCSIAVVGIAFVVLRKEGDANRRQVRLALEQIGYNGFLTPELHGGDEAYLRDLSERIDKITAMS